MARGRPAGMFKKDGLWYMADGTLSPSSAAKVNGGTVTLAITTITVPEPAQSATEGVTKQVTQGIHTYTRDELTKIETATGLVYAGSFANCDGGKYSGELVPVILRADHTEEKRQEIMTKIRKGV